MSTSYDKFPYVPVDEDARLCLRGWAAIAERLKAAGQQGSVLCIECYPGLFESEVVEALTAYIRPAVVIRAQDALRPPEEIESIVRPFLTDDPVFGLMNDLRLQDLFDPALVAELRRQVQSQTTSVTLVVGTGAYFIAPQSHLLVYADLARWEIQQRQRRNEITNFGAANLSDPPSLKYKRGFFIDWRAADQLKQQLLNRIDFLLDTNTLGDPKMITGDQFRRGLDLASQRPFRVVPFFDPGPWGGDWMMNKFDLPGDRPNYAWGFDCVPEENSLLLGFGDVRVEIPAIDAVFRRPKELLGAFVHSRFGAEFPIRFDFLDTMNGGNLSLQVHPLTSYIRQHFGMSYTQDESYYMLDAGPDASVFLGLKEGIDCKHMVADLRSAQEGEHSFPAEEYVNRWPARKHDHFLIPAGTIHCSARNSVVLEISATPYIFTFKLWDWGRMGLDGRPRPIHLEHGIANIQWDRTTEWVRRNLVNQIQTVEHGPCWREERTGLHSLEFIETRRHWFTGPVPHETNGSVHVLNLVEGEAAVVESPTNAFDPWIVHYGESFIVPAAVERYTIRPLDSGAQCATMRASVRESNAG
ncbi:MAG TPA: class I mannose-6-phosphate isomerase [Bryobacteraceae bacterium]|nr:class I mannose-6-phosphate isomerase [Bryobacteraceae bacterium]